jgi:formylglycine-generating enzyme required for sulfatase activity
MNHTVKMRKCFILGMIWLCAGGYMSAHAASTPTQAAPLSLDLGGGTTMELVLVPAGEFMMGRDTGSAPEEKPVHKVKISQPFYMAKYETTQEQYEKVMGTNPSSFKNPKNPVENVSWNDAQEFCKKVGAMAKRQVQLPTEAQWEYACRAGSAKDDEGPVFELGWHDNCGYPRHPHTVGEKAANAFGLYDMYGNVGEWCSDWYDAKYYETSPSVDPQGPAQGTDKVSRGGAWGQHVASCMPACRQNIHPVTVHYYYGFRIVAIASK